MKSHARLPFTRPLGSRDAIARFARYALVLAALTASGCTPSLYAVTPAPPTRVAELRTEVPVFSKNKHHAKLSVGVALGFNCVHGRPCTDMRTTIANPGIVKILPAHLAGLERDAFTRDSTPHSTLVMVGLAPGKTKVRLDTKQGNTIIHVTVLP